MAAAIEGFTPHALKRMMERGITRRAVEDACKGNGIVQGNGNVRYVGAGCTVVLNANGWVVTVF